MRDFAVLVIFALSVLFTLCFSTAAAIDSALYLKAVLASANPQPGTMLHPAPLSALLKAGLAATFAYLSLYVAATTWESLYPRDSINVNTDPETMRWHIEKQIDADVARRLYQDGIKQGRKQFASEAQALTIRPGTIPAKIEHPITYARGWEDAIAAVTCLVDKESQPK